MAFALADHLALNDDQAEKSRRAASFVLLGSSDDGLPLVPQDAEDARMWVQELATKAKAAIVRFWAAQQVPLTS